MAVQKTKVSEFFKTDYQQYGMYDNFRMLASVTDGMKPSARKVVHTVSKMRQGEILKVAQLAPRVSEDTNYLHGEGSLCGVIVGLAQDFIGSNNINLLAPEGSFGSRMVQSAAAGRYIFTGKSKMFDRMFIAADADLLPKQEFEGDPIEPRHFAPVLPLLLINGSEGMGSGFAQKIMPRKVKDVAKVVKDMIRGGAPQKIIPGFEGFKGKVRIRVNRNDAGEKTGETVEVFGAFRRKDSTHLEIYELPIGHCLKSFIDTLNDLEEKGVIRGFEDYSNTKKDEFLFEVAVSRQFAEQDDEDILNQLKLVKRTSENFTCIDEKNSVVEFNDETDVLRVFFELRMKYYVARRQRMIDDLEEELKVLSARARFVEDVVEGRLEVFRRKKVDVEADMDRIGYVRRDGSHDWLLSMGIMSLTAENIAVLREKIAKAEKELEKVRSTTVGEMWTKDIDDLVSSFEEFQKEKR